MSGGNRSDDTASKQEVNPTNTQCNNATINSLYEAVSDRGVSGSVAMLE
ncbi:MAG: hypothetical protein V7K69_10030 [Nostoc sp.]